jgi:hypothetical protein
MIYSYINVVYYKMYITFWIPTICITYLVTKFIHPAIPLVGVGYGMEMDSYKSRILDGVLVQKRNRTSRCLKLHVAVSHIFGTKCTHSRIPGFKGEALFSKL